MLKNGLYNLIGTLIGTGISFLSIPVIIHFIGIQEYGLFSLVSSVMGIVLLAEAGLSISTTVFLARDLAKENPDSISSTLTVSLGAMFILATTVVIFLALKADGLVALFPGLESSEKIIFVQGVKLSGLIIWARLLQGIFISIEQAYDRYDLMNILNTLQSTINAIGLMAVAGLGGHSVELIAWQGLITMGILIAHGWVGRQLTIKANLRPIWDSQKSWSILRYSLMTWGTSLGNSLFAQGDRLVIGSLFNTQIVGFYSVITIITRQINTFSALPVQPLLPRFSYGFQKGQTQLEGLIKQALQINGLVAIGLGGNLFTLAPILMSVMIPGTIVDEYILPFRLAILIYTIYSLNAVGFYFLFTVNAVNVCMTIQLVAGILSLLFINIGGIMFDFLGAILGNALYCLTLLMVFISLRKSQIPVLLWFSWLQFLLFWFGAVIIVNLLSPDLVLWKVLITIGQNLILLKWSMSLVSKNIQEKII